MLTLEIKKIIKRREFLFVTGLMFISVIVDYLVNCYNYYGSYKTMLYPAYNMTILDNVSRSPYCIVFMLALPLVASIAASDMYCTDAAMNINSYIITRIDKKTYVKYQALAIYITVFTITCLMLFLNLLLCVATFPIKGYSLNRFIMPYDLVLYNAGSFNSGTFLYDLQLAHPYINIIFFILMRGFIAGIFSLLAYGVSFFRFANKYVVFVSSFVIYNIIEVGEYILERVVWKLNMQESWISNLCYSGVLQLNPNGNVYTYFKDFIIYLIFAVILIFWGRKQEDI